MAEEQNAVQLIERLRKREKILCGVCQKSYYDTSGDEEIVSRSNYFHCADSHCSGSVHIQAAIDVD